ncbi:ABC transporter permease [Roseivirga sp. E12]|uniref:ABC transporter permease n=1 Tax=Roseivirga sp. E12 TaxID=2819237 RepID=UPI001ABD001F|nr:ABC transporter permease [Roseivirga sp. E12]MBO3698107.1 ABC transporter permease [Roseivirga sp. E12]
MSQQNVHSRPPRFGEWLLRSFCSYDYLNTALWDMEEIYQNNIERKGKAKARWLYTKEALGVVYHLYFKGKSQYSINSIAMLKNNIIVSLRNLRKHKGNSFVNILGLSSALVIFLLTLAYTTYEFSYDTHHDQSEDIYRVYKSVNTINDPEYRDSGTPAPLADALTSEFPQILGASRVMRYRKILMETDTEKFIEPLVHPADPSIFKVFTFNPVSGNIVDFIAEPLTVALSKTTALKYFNSVDVIGKTVTFNSQLPMKITGVFEDMPDNSHFKMNVLVHLESVMEAFNQNMTLWGNNPFYTYLRTKPRTDVADLEGRLPEIRAKYANDPMDADGQEYTYFLQPFAKVHFDQKIIGSLGTPVDGKRLNMFLIIATIILGMACINYVNLATARSIVKMKEVGIRKVIGAKRGNIILQLLMESGLLVFISLTLAIVVTGLVLPTLANFVDRPLTLDFQELNLWIFVIGLGVIITLISGIYPALITTNFKPINALNGRGIVGKKGGGFLRNILVVFQFSASFVLIIGALILGRQLSYIDNKDTGYSRDKIVVLSTSDDAVDDRLNEYMEEISKVSGVSAVATSWSLPTNVTSNTQANWTGISDAERLPMYMVGVTHEFFDLYDIEVIEGRSFDKEIRTDRKSILLNETAVRKLGWENPIGREMITQSGIKSTVIGVVKDFHIKSLREEIEPLQIILSGNYATLSVKIEADLYETLVKIEEVYDSFSPVYPFEYRLFEDIYDNAYAQDQKTSELSLWLTLITIVIACLGLYGLATHKVERKTQEMGIRKILGASTSSILSLLAKDFTKLLFLAFLVAGPVAYYILNQWLDGFAYHIEIDVVTFVVSLLLMVLIAAVTIGYRTYSAAVSNPVDALRDE